MNIIERIAHGKSLREKTTRSSQSEWKPPSDRPDPVEILIKTNEDRVEELKAERFRRMKETPFTFFRGTAAIMASDLSRTAVSGINIQCCGDCHLMNFGSFASPERNMIFDMNDFDETHSAPWEWDLKRLAASFIIAGNSNKYSKKINKNAALTLVRSYRKNMNRYSSMGILDAWYSKIDEPVITKFLKSDKEYINQFKKIKDEKSQRKKYSLPEFVKFKNGKAKIIDQEDPLIYHSNEIHVTEEKMKKFFKNYEDSLHYERRLLFCKYEFSDIAYKVSGVGSVGRKCYVAAFIGYDNHVLLLQVKEAKKSVLEEYTCESGYANHGERIINGQRIMQAASDIFLGWAEREDGKQFYVRQLNDNKIEMKIYNQPSKAFIKYAELCGWALSKSHSKADGAAYISGYLGGSEEFDEAISEFAFRYTEQNEKDYNAFIKAIGEGRIKAG